MSEVIIQSVPAPQSADGLLDRLPPKAAAKAAAFRECSAREAGYARQIHDDRDDLVPQRQAAAQALTEAEKHYGVRRTAEHGTDHGTPYYRSGPKPTTEQHPAVQAARARYDAEKAKDRELVAKMDRVSAAAIGWRTPVERLEAWLRTIPANTAIPSHRGTIAVPKTATIDSAREHIAALKSELDAVRAAPHRSVDVIAEVDAMIDSIAEGARPDLFDAIERGGGLIGWPTMRLTALGATSDAKQVTSSTTVTDPIALLAWLDADRLKARLRAEIEACADDDHALAPDERRTREADLLKRILAAERVEETLIEQSEPAGPVYLRRADADVRAVFGLADELPPFTE